MDDAPLLHTDRLVMRGWREADLTPFAELNSDPAVMEHFPSALTREESDALVARTGEHFREHGYGLWAVEVAETGELAGFVGLNRPSFEAEFTPCVEVGWRLARHSWGKGYASEAAREALRFGFTEAGLDEVLSWTVPANVRSIAVMERIGLERRGEFGHPRVQEGHPLHRHVIYGIDRERWASVA